MQKSEKRNLRLKVLQDLGVQLTEDMDREELKAHTYSPLLQGLEISRDLFREAQKKGQTPEQYLQALEQKISETKTLALVQKGIFLGAQGALRKVEKIYEAEKAQGATEKPSAQEIARDLRGRAKS